LSKLVNQQPLGAAPSHPRGPHHPPTPQQPNAPTPPPVTPKPATKSHAVNMTAHPGQGNLEHTHPPPTPENETPNQAFHLGQTRTSPTNPVHTYIPDTVASKQSVTQSATRSVFTQEAKLRRHMYVPSQSHTASRLPQPKEEEKHQKPEPPEHTHTSPVSNRPSRPTAIHIQTSEYYPAGGPKGPWHDMTGQDAAGRHACRQPCCQITCSCVGYVVAHMDGDPDVCRGWSRRHPSNEDGGGGGGQRFVRLCFVPCEFDMISKALCGLEIRQRGCCCW
jgi:hypothetical protein